MGWMLMLGAVMWTGIVLSAVHLSSTGGALSVASARSVASNLACTGSSCGIETDIIQNFEGSREELKYMRRPPTGSQNEENLLSFSIPRYECVRGVAIGYNTAKLKVRRRSFTNRDVVTSRKLILVSKLSTSDTNDLLLDRDERGDILFGEDYGRNPPPPPRSAQTPPGPDQYRRPLSPPAKAPGAEPITVPPPPLIFESSPPTTLVSSPAGT